MSYEDITDKLNLYKNTYVKGECRSREYEARIKQEKRLNLKLDLADTLCNELPFHFTTSQKNHVKELIRIFPNFKDLHSKASNEEIILSFIFYVKALKDKKDRLNVPTSKELIHNILKDNNKEKIYPKTFEIIKWKITLHYINNSTITPRQPINVDHNILYKGRYES